MTKILYVSNVNERAQYYYSQQTRRNIPSSRPRSFHASRSTREKKTKEEEEEED